MNKLFTTDEPIITSLLDLDFYKLTMAQVVWKRYRDVPVRYKLFNRTEGTSLSSFVSREELREQLEHIRTLCFTQNELSYLHHDSRVQGVFSPSFLEALGALRLPEIDLDLLEVSGSWFETILWETIVLCVVNELRCSNETKKRGITERELHREGMSRARMKIDRILERPAVKITEFGTRRRMSKAWQHRILEELRDRLGEHQLLGTSNVALAREFGLRPIGTMAHEMFMVLYGIASSKGFGQPAHIAHRQVLDLWWKTYGDKLAVALTDTYGTDFFLHNLPPKQALRWKGYRLDSGDLIATGEKVLTHLHFLKQKGFHLEPEKKLLLPSDGMTVPKIIKFTDHFRGRAKVTCAIGTDATFDVGHLRPWSIVMKVVESCGQPTPKLSDNPAKATGKPKEIERVKREVGYQDRPAEPLVY